LPRRDRHPRPPRSFPTRRSSDLGGTLDTVSRHYNETVTALAGQQGLYGKASRFNELSSKANKAMPALEPLHADFESERLALIASDRKSTRLNSSHVKISYAVFCL